MIVAGYTLHLYCECAACTSNLEYRKWNGGFAEIADARKDICFAYARRTGWKINEAKDICIAPGHGKKKK